MSAFFGSSHVNICSGKNLDFFFKKSFTVLKGTWLYKKRVFTCLCVRIATKRTSNLSATTCFGSFAVRHACAFSKENVHSSTFSFPVGGGAGRFSGH